MSVAGRLEELGVTLPESAAALGVYRAAIRSGNIVYVSGQLPMRDSAIVHPGIVGAGVTVEQGQEAARVATVNALAAVQGLLGDLEGVRLVRTVGYVACTAEFEQQPVVVNGASTFLREVFGDDRGVGARIAIGVASLPARAPVEIELWFETQRPLPE